MEEDAHQLAQLLAAEFPDLPLSLIEQALHKCDLEVPEARRKLLQLQEEEEAGQAGQHERSGESTLTHSPPSEAGEDWGWSGFSQSMRDMGLESLGAQLQLLGRQVAAALHDVLPAELNPFGTDEEEVEEEEARAAARAAHEAEVERGTAAVAGGGVDRRVQHRRVRGGSTMRPARGYTPETDEEEDWEEEEDDCKLA